MPCSFYLSIIFIFSFLFWYIQYASYSTVWSSMRHFNVKSYHYRQKWPPIPVIFAVRGKKLLSGDMLLLNVVSRLFSVVQYSLAGSEDAAPIDGCKEKYSLHHRIIEDMLHFATNSEEPKPFLKYSVWSIPCCRQPWSCISSPVQLVLFVFNYYFLCVYRFSFYGPYQTFMAIKKKGSISALAW